MGPKRNGNADQTKVSLKKVFLTRPNVQRNLVHPGLNSFSIFFRIGQKSIILKRLTDCDSPCPT